MMKAKNEANKVNEDLRFRTLIKKHPDAMVVVNQQGEVRFANPAAESLFGKEARQMIDRKFGFPIRVGETIEVTINQDDGNTINAEMQVVACKWEGETANLVSLHDLTSHAETERELRRRNQFINTILDNLPIGIAVNSIEDGKTRYMNAKFEQIYGWPREVLVDVEEFFRHIYPEAAYRKAIQERVISDIASGDPSRMLWEDITITTQDGGRRIVTAKNIPLVEQNLMISTVQDVTARKQAEEQLIKLSQAVEQSSSAILIYAADGKVEYVNSMFTQLSGRTEEETIGAHVSSLGELSSEENQRIWETITRGQEWHGEIRNRKHGDETYWVFASISPIRNAEGKITHFVEVHEDITVQKLAEAEIRKQAEDLALLHAVNTAINRGKSLPEVIQLLEEESKRIFDSYGVAVYLISADKGHMIPQNSPLTAATVDQIDKLVQAKYRSVKIPLKEGSVYLEVLRTGKPRLINDPQSLQQLIAEFTKSILLPKGVSPAQIRQRASKLHALLSEEIRSLMILPLVLEGEDIGLLEVYRREPFTQADLQRFDTIAGQLTTTIHRAILQEQTEKRLQRLKAMRNIDRAITASFDLELVLEVLLDQVTSQLGVDAASVLLVNPNTQMLEYAAGRGFGSLHIHLTRLRPEEGYAGRVVQERRLIKIQDLRTHADNTRWSSFMVHEEKFVTYYCVPLVVKGELKGALEIFHRKMLAPDHEWLEFLDALAGQAAIAIDEASLFEDLQRSNNELAVAYETTLRGWVQALDLRDKETTGHTLRVTEMTVRMAREMGIPESELVHIQRGALLHDIGKIGVPDSILHKPGPLDAEEWKLIQKHPVLARELLAPVDYLKPALDIPYYHHEKWDGSGYPHGLEGEQIPLAARIFAVADVWDALRSDRPYRDAWSEEEALAYIRSQAGKHFDPQVVEVFLHLNTTAKKSVSEP